MKTFIVGLLVTFSLLSMCWSESKAKKIAENDPEAFQMMLEKHLLKTLLEKRKLEDYSCIDKYDKFVDSIQNETSRSKAREFLLDLRKNYKTTWHLRYPIKLSKRWYEIKGNPIAKRDLTEMLRINGVSDLPDQDSVIEAMEPKSGIRLFATVEYLDPLKVAIAKLSDEIDPIYKFKSKGLGSKNRVESAGIPLDTFYYYSFDLVHDLDEVNRLIFMVDSYDRVVAVQEIVEAPQKKRLTGHNNIRSVYNFLQMRRKGTPRYLIGYKPSISSYGRSSSSAKVVVMESELLDLKRKPREWVKLHMPMRIARVCMLCSRSIQD